MVDIKGQKKGASGGSSGKEDPNTLITNTIAKTVYLFSEGPIQGLSTGDAKSIYFNDVPIVDGSGNNNYNGISWTFRTGLPSQTVIPGFNGAVTPTVVNTKVLFATPVTRTITGNFDAINVTIAVPVLSWLDNNSGALKGTELSYSIDVKTASGSYVTVKTETLVRQKTTSEWDKTYRVELPAGGSPWTVRVNRLTADSVTSNIVNDMYFSAYATVVDGKFSYRNSAVLGLQLNAKQFQNQLPTVKAQLKGIQVWVPKNYDPVTRVYATVGPGTSGGIWDGTFKAAFTDNPAWIFYDLIINNRYGLGQDFNPTADPTVALIDKWSLYTLAQFCDGSVSDGFGGTEARYRINTQILDKQDAYELLQSIAATFNGMMYFSANQIYAVADVPATVSDIFTQADVEEGIFEYSGTALKTRHSAVISWFNDAKNLYKRDSVVFEDADLIAKIGYRSIEINPIGCTSRAQALRSAKWLLNTEKNQTQSVTFKTGHRGGFLTPGTIIKIFDDYKAGTRMGGRILTSSIVSGTTYSFTTDAPVTAAIGDKIIYQNSDGVPITFTFTSTVTAQTTFNITGSGLPVDGGAFAIIAAALDGQLYKVLQISEDGPEKYHVIALQHNESKFAIIDATPVFTPTQTSLLSAGQVSAPTNVTISQWWEGVSGAESFPHITASWQSPTDFRVAGFEVHLKTPLADYTPVYSGPNVSWDSGRLISSNANNFSIRVRAYDNLGRVSNWTYNAAFSVVGDNVIPTAPTSFTASTTLTTSILLNWTTPTNTDLKWVEVWQNSVNNSATATKLAEVTHNYFSFEAGPTPTTSYFWLKTITRSLTNATSAFSAVATGSNYGTLVPDTTPPAVPTSLAALAGFNSIWLTWVNPSDTDTSLVEIWENTTNSSGSATRIAIQAASPGTNGAFVRSGLANGVTRYYWLKAGDKSNNLSGFSSVATTTTATISPTDLGTAVSFGAVTGLTLSTSLALDTDQSQYITLNAGWTAISDPSISFYEVAIQEASGTFIVYTTSTLFYQWTVKANISYTVKVRGVDRNGNRGAYSSTSTLTSTRDNAAPGVATGVTALAAVKTVFVYWTNPSDVDVATAEVWYNTSNTTAGATRIGVVNAAPSTISSFTQAGLGTQTQFWFFIKVLDTSGNASAYSSSATTTTAAITTADIVAGSITADRITAGTITGSLFNTGTSLPGSITLGATGVTITTMATDPGSVINATGTTKIIPGLIQVSGSTTLADWRQGGDTTKIAGGSISANTISANKIEIGSRNVTILGVTFIHNCSNFALNTLAANSVAWSTGTIIYSDDAGALQAASISAGTSSYGGSQLYLYWTKGGTTVNATTTSATAYTSTTIVLAIYGGGTSLFLGSGKTVIDGDSIRTGSVTAANIAAGTITANEIAATTITAAKIVAGTITGTQIAATTISASNIVSNTITAAQIAAGTITANEIAATTITAAKIVSGTITSTQIASNTISADKIEIRTRGVDVIGLIFEHNTATQGSGTVSTNSVAWSAGTIAYVNDSNTYTTQAITASTSSTSVGTPLYIYWVKGAGTLSATNTQATAYGSSNIVLAIYNGGTNLAVTYGRTVIDGSNITTGSITAGRITAGTITANEIIGGAITNVSWLESNYSANLTNTSTQVYSIAHTTAVASAPHVINLNATCANGAGNAGVTLLIYSDATLIAVRSFFCQASFSVTGSFMVFDQPTSGAHTYYIYAQTTAGSGANCFMSAVNMTVTELKR